MMIWLVIDRKLEMCLEHVFDSEEAARQYITRLTYDTTHLEPVFSFVRSIEEQGQ